MVLVLSMFGTSLTMKLPTMRRYQTFCWLYWQHLSHSYFSVPWENGLDEWAMRMLRDLTFLTPVPDETYSQCLGDEHELSRDSFPSGHASISFCGLTLLTLYCHNRFGLPSIKCKAALAATTAEDLDGGDALRDGKEPRRSRYTKDPLPYIFISVASLAPMALALFIAASRIVDNLHFPSDVVGGSVLGASIANFVHGLWL